MGAALVPALAEVVVKVRVRGGALLILGAGRAAVVLLQAITVGLQARALSVGGFSLLVTLQAVMLLLLALSDFGFSGRALRVSAEEEPGLGSRLLLVRLLAVAVLTPTVIVVFVVQGASRLDPSFVIVVLTFVAIENLADLHVSVLLGHRRRSLAMLHLVARRAAALLPLVFDQNEGAVLLGLTISAAYGLAISIVPAIGAVGRGPSVKSLFRTSVPYWSLSLVQSTSRFDVLLIGLVGGPSLAGLYAGAARYGNAVNTGTSVVLQYSVPEMAAQTDAAKRSMQYKRLMLMVSAYALVLVAAAPFSSVLVRVLLGPDFVDAAPVLAGVLAAAALSALTQARLGWHTAVGLRTSVVARVLIGNVSTLALLCVGSNYGPEGLGCALVVANLSMLMLVTSLRRSHAN